MISLVSMKFRPAIDFPTLARARRGTYPPVTRIRLRSPRGKIRVGGYVSALVNASARPAVLPVLAALAVLLLAPAQLCRPDAELELAGMGAAAAAAGERGSNASSEALAARREGPSGEP